MPARMPAPLVLEILDPAGDPHRVTLAPSVEPIVIGSSMTCGVHIEAPQVEPEHAELYVDGQHWCLRDRNSSNGTFLDDNRLFVTSIRLEVGQRVRLGIGDAAARFTIVDGAAREREGVDVRLEVASYVKAQKRERRKRVRRWAIALPSAGMVAILGVWGVGALMISQDQADRAAHPERYQNEPNNEGIERLAAIMAGDARPEDVDVKQIVAAASLGRSSKIVDAALRLVKPDSVLVGSASAAPSVSQASAPQANHHAPSAAAVDENVLARLIQQQGTIDADHLAAVQNEIASQSQTITLRRLRSLLDERSRLADAATKRGLSKPDQTRLAEIERRLNMLGVDAGTLNWRAGDDLSSLESQLDPAVLERIRLQLVKAMSVK